MYDLRADWPRLTAAFDAAPSVFNTRPWEFRVVPRAGPAPPDKVELRLPGMAGLPLPRRRESVISCGAALFNLRMAIRVAGHDLEVWLLPDPGQPDLLAVVEVVTARTKKAPHWEQGLYGAISLRHTNRWPYVMPAPLPVIEEMENAAAREGAYLRSLSPRQARKWLRVTAEVDEKFTAPFPNRVDRATYGPRPANRSRITRKDYRVTRKDFWLRKELPFERKPQLLALSTDDDTTVNWLVAGQALERALLTGTWYSRTKEYGRTALYHAPAHRPRRGFPARQHPLTRRPDEVAPFGLSMSPLTQRLEYEDSIGRPRRWPWRWRYAEIPQLVMRVGYTEVEEHGAPAPAPQPSPRGE